MSGEVTNRTFNPTGSAQVDTIKAAFEAVEAVEAAFEAVEAVEAAFEAVEAVLETAAMFAVKSVFEP